MDEAAITRYIATAFAGVDIVVASRENGASEISWGDTFVIYTTMASRRTEQR